MIYLFVFFEESSMERQYHFAHCSLKRIPMELGILADQNTMNGEKCEEYLDLVVTQIFN